MKNLMQDSVRGTISEVIDDNITSRVLDKTEKVVYNGRNNLKNSQYSIVGYTVIVND